MRKKIVRQIRRIRKKLFRFGAHSLSVLFTINTQEKLDILTEAMRETVRHGGTIFEIPYLLVGGDITWTEIAAEAKDSGIQEIALCHFWPYNKDGNSICGDPLGGDAEVIRALETVEAIIGVADIIRLFGIKVRFIDGPTWGGLGKDYSHLTCREIHHRIVSFLKKAGAKCAKAGLILAVEFLRGIEDKVVGGTRAMIRILKAVNHRAVKMHFDVFHSIEQRENPAKSIRLGKKWIVYLHLHGDKRVAPGSDDDKRSWIGIVAAILEINSGVHLLPALPEPFGEKTCRENRALGEGLPPMPAFPGYLELTRQTLESCGLPMVA